MKIVKKAYCSVEAGQVRLVFFVFVFTCVSGCMVNGMVSDGRHGAC